MSRHGGELSIYENVFYPAGWTREIPGEVYRALFPNIPFVWDGNGKGRGTTGIDLYHPATGRVLSVKTASEFCSKLSMMTGRQDTMEAFVNDCRNVLPGVNVVAVATDKATGKVGCLSFNLSKLLRSVEPAALANYPEGGYKKGQAPSVYVKPSKRPSGGTYVEERVIVYNELVVSLPSSGLRWKDGADLASLAK